MKPHINKEEFKQRILDTQERMKQESLDVLLCFANEAEPQFVRYYSNYWPSFEFAGVLLAQAGDPILLIGPESETYARHTSVIPTIRRLLAFRESSNPEYPDMTLDTFESVIKEDLQLEKVKRAGIAGYGLITHLIHTAFSESLSRLGAHEIVNADHVVAELRATKSAAELACMREAYRIASEAMKDVLAKIHVGMTENQVKGVAMAKIFEEGGEGEAYPFWILTGEDSNQAISRCRGKFIQEGDLVQIQVAARYEGYAATIGRPVVMGKATPYLRDMIAAGYATQKALIAESKTGNHSLDVFAQQEGTLKPLGFADHILYGPCHGTGLMEGEYPWIEANSDFLMKKDMTFCTCVYLGNDEKKLGIRVEDGYVVTDEGGRLLTDASVPSGLIEIEVK